MTALSIIIVASAVSVGVWLILVSASIAHHQLTVKRWKQIAEKPTSLDEDL